MPSGAVNRETLLRRKASYKRDYFEKLLKDTVSAELDQNEEQVAAKLSHLAVKDPEAQGRML